MLAKSEQQREAAGVTLSAKRGQKNPNELNGPAKQMYDSMNEKQLEEMAKKES